MKPAAWVKYFSFFLSWHGLLFFVMAFAPFAHWIDYNYGHYGIWRKCEDGCEFAGWGGDEDTFNAQVVPRCLMLVSFVLLSVSAYFTYHGFQVENAAWSFFVSGVIQFFAALAMIAAFVASFLARTTEGKGRVYVGFSALMAIIGGILFAVSGIMSMVLFCHQKLTEAHSAILLDARGRTEVIHGAEVEFFDAKRR